MPSTDLIEAYLRERAEADGLAPSTLHGYREELELLNARQVPLTPEGIAGFVSNHPDGSPLAPNTRNRRLAILRAFSRWLVRHHHLAKNPTRGLKRAKVPQGFTASVGADDLQRVLAALVTRPSGWRRTRDLALVLVPFYTGLRVTELHRLDTRQVDADAALLRHAVRKGGSTTDVLLHLCAVRVLRAWLGARPASDEPALFIGERGPRLGVRGIQKVYEGLRRDAGLSVRFHPHRLRHAYATALLGRGVTLGTIQRLMNHASIQTTSRYLHADEDMMRAAVALLPDLLGDLCLTE
ncbi:MAG: tyrosine-type recombinase/integrase [Pseudomonadota bacterium]|nr:tyrosine-type recombinase/integrase [Pseudomonadota bacterium]